jgi:formylmethanofuran dehydrogenase subunit C
MNSSKEDKFVIHTAHIAQPIHLIGHRNTKNIIVNGNACNSVGYGMRGGSIIVKGDAGSLIGSRMEDGTIAVNGNAGVFIGARMSGGEIHIEGGHGSIADNIIHGKIFHKGKLIVDK